MAWTLPGNKIYENVTPATVAGSPIVTGWIDTTGFTTVLPAFVFTNSTGATAFTCEGSFDGSTQETDITYAALTTGTAFSVLHPYIRFRIVQTTADATRTKIFCQARA